VTRTTERVLNPVLGKSVVVYARKPGSGRTPTAQDAVGEAVEQPVASENGSTVNA